MLIGVQEMSSSTRVPNSRNAWQAPKTFKPNPMEIPQVLDRVAKFLPTTANSASMALMSKAGRVAVKGRELNRNLIKNLRQNEDMWVHVYRRKKLMPRLFTFYLHDPRVRKLPQQLKPSFALMPNHSGQPVIFSRDPYNFHYLHDSVGAQQSTVSSVFDMGRKQLLDVVSALNNIIAAPALGLDDFDKFFFDVDHYRMDAVQRSRLWDSSISAHQRHIDLIASRSKLHPTSVQGRRVNADIRAQAAKMGSMLAHNNQIRAESIAHATRWRARILQLIDLYEIPVVQSARSRLKGSSSQLGSVIYTGGRTRPNKHRKITMLGLMQ